MTIAEVLLILFGVLASAAALGIVFTKNLVHAAFLLVMCLLSLAALYVLYEATFLAVVQIMVYAGGVLILLGFGIMLTNRSVDGRMLSKHHLLVIGGISTLVLLVILMLKLDGSLFTSSSPVVQDSQIEKIGVGFMTQYILAFELIAYLLLVVLVGASYHAKRSSDG